MSLKILHAYYSYNENSYVEDLKRFQRYTSHVPTSLSFWFHPTFLANSFISYISYSKEYCIYELPVSLVLFPHILQLIDKVYL